MTEDVERALETLRNGGVILYPTDTVWGLGCDATNEAAVEKILAIKKRPETKGMLVLMENTALLARYIYEVPELAFDLIELSVSPLTIIFQGARNLARNLLAEDGSIGIRFTREEFSKKLISRLRHPIVSTSANSAGEPTPATFREIKDEIKSSVGYIVKYRQDDNNPGKPSGIIKLFPDSRIEIIRQ